MASLPAPGSGGGSSTNSPKSNGLTYTINTNGLWLAITNVSNGWSYLNLHNGTNQVYAIWSTTNLLAGWQVETEVWPTNGKVTPTTTPFTVATLARQNLFLQAEDWTGVTENGNTTPEWWFWANFGTIALSDTNLDSSGNTLLFDFQNGINPNMNFTVNLGNQHFNMTTPVGTFFVLSGTPGTEAVLVNSTNFNSAVWQPYDGNVKMSLGPTDGVYQVWMGLKGSAPGSQPAWINRTVYLDRVAPKVTITNPTNSTTSQPMIQIQGYAGKPLSQITLKNAAGVFTNQTGYGYVTNQFFDTNLLAFTTNYFQCFDVPLTNGVNSLTIFATDLAGNTTAVTTNYTLNLSGDHTPPVLSIIWPQSGTFISGQTFTLQASMDDNTAKATATMTDSFGKTNTVQALVERSGLIWAQNLPMSAGTNTLKLTATDAAGNVSTTNLTLIQSSVIVTMNPLTGVQFNQPYVTVYGTINTTAAQVYVNGIQAIVNANGTWSANSVPASPVGTAAFDVEVYGGTSQNVAGGGGLHANGLPGGTATGSEQFPNVQPATVGLMSYNGNQTYTISSTMVNSTWAEVMFVQRRETPSTNPLFPP